MNSYFYYRIEQLFSKKPHLKPKNDMKKTDEINEDEEPELLVERIRLEKIELRLLNDLSKILYLPNLCSDKHYSYPFDDSLKNLMSKMTIQEPTFDRMIVVYRWI